MTWSATVTLGSLLAVMLALGGCSSDDPAAAPTAAPTGMVAPTGTVATSQRPPTPTGDVTAPESVATPVPELTAPTTVAATTAGPLSGKDFPTFPGWSRGVGDGDDGRYLPNGTWVHDVAPALAVADLMAQGCAEVPAAAPTPVAALGATYVGPKRQPGTALALAFATAAQARAFATVYRGRAQECSRAPGAGPSITVLPSASRLIDRKDLGTEGTWVELAQVQGERFVVTMLADPDGSIWRRGATLATWGSW